MIHTLFAICSVWTHASQGKSERSSNHQCRTSAGSLCFVRINHLFQYRSKDRPWYSLGHGIVLAYIAIGLVSSVITRFVLKRENERREKGERDEVILEVENIERRVPGGKGGDETNGIFANIDMARTEKGDKWSGFRYSL